MLCPGSLLDFGVRRTNDGLDLSTVDKASDVRVGDLCSWKADGNILEISDVMQEGRSLQVILFVNRRLVESTKDLIKETKSALGPNDEATDVTTRSKL